MRLGFILASSSVLLPGGFQSTILIVFDKIIA